MDTSNEQVIVLLSSLFVANVDFLNKIIKVKWDIIIKYWVQGQLETSSADAPCFCSVHLLSVFAIVSLF